MIRAARDGLFAVFVAVLAVSSSCTCGTPVDGDGSEGEGEAGEGEGEAGEGEGEAGEGEGEGEGEGDYTPPAGPYFLISPVAASQGEESDALSADGEFTAQVRVGNVEDISAASFVITWDPAVIAHVSRERTDEWLTSAGGTILPLTDNLDEAAGQLTVGFAISNGPVSTATSEAIYRITFDFVGAAQSTEIAPDFSQGDGLVQDGGAETIELTVVPLSVTP